VAPRCQLCDGPHPGEPADCPDARTGQRIGDKYAVGRLIGIGGIAAVYGATHLVLRRDIAIKVIHRHQAKDHELGVRFVREARETAAMGHPAFVDVYDAGYTEDGCAYIEMENLFGRDLYAVRKADGVIAPARAAKIAIEVLDALEALHARGVIHRDLKSANIFLTADEQVKLLDLGFAKVAGELAITVPNQLVGTPFYMSPEQYADPTTVDGRCDIFSMGIVLFEILTGTWPYTYASKRELFSKVMKGNLERHPQTRRAEIPTWLDAIVAKSLAFDRNDRYPTAEAMKLELQRADGPPTPVKSGFFRRLVGR
jgi:serine/threonine-protein kinase